MIKQYYVTATGLKIENSNDEDDAISFFEKIASIMWKWIDRSLVGQLGTKFPDNLIETRGKAIADIVYVFSGRKIAGLTPISICILN